MNYDYAASIYTTVSMYIIYIYIKITNMVK